MSDTYNSPVPEPKEQIKDDHGKVVKKVCECGETVSTRGYAQHARHCEEAKAAYSDGSEGGEHIENDSQSEDPEEDPNDRGGEPEQLEVTPECPKCGSELKTANDVAKHYQQRGAKETAQQVRQYDYVCIADECVDDTLTVLNSDELGGDSDD